MIDWPEVTLAAQFTDSCQGHEISVFVVAVMSWDINKREGASLGPHCLAVGIEPHSGTRPQSLAHSPRWVE